MIIYSPDMTPTPRIVVFPSVNRAVFGELCLAFCTPFHEALATGSVSGYAVMSAGPHVSAFTKTE